MKNLTLYDVREFLMNTSDEDLVKIQETIKYRQDRKRLAIKNNISVGDLVKFRSAKDAEIYSAVVTKIARKRAHVSVRECENRKHSLYSPGTTVTVPMEMLNF
jgi:flagella basal body P-ring formation protein FlgA